MELQRRHPNLRQSQVGDEAPFEEEPAGDDAAGDYARPPWRRAEGIHDERRGFMGYTTEDDGW